MSWFYKLMGFNEISPDNVMEKIKVEGTQLTSSVNGESFQFGRLETPSLEEIRLKIDLEKYDVRLQLSEVVGDIQEFHKDTKNTGALFQAASQFNLLEMVSPQVSPNAGVGIYERDYTQGPACAIACGAGTIYRNYFAEVNGHIGQTDNYQINCLDEIGNYFNNHELDLWEMSNGYALANKGGLEYINNHLEVKENIEKVKSLLKIGVQWDTEVTISPSRQLVSQVYCSALPVAYSHLESADWEPFSRVILSATYEATLYAGLINFKRTGNNNIFLTLVGGGAFGNDNKWISESLLSTLTKFKNTPLEVKIVSYGRSQTQVEKMINDFQLKNG